MKYISASGDEMANQALSVKLIATRKSDALPVFLTPNAPFSMVSCKLVHDGLPFLRAGRVEADLAPSVHHLAWFQ